LQYYKSEYLKAVFEELVKLLLNIKKNLVVYSGRRGRLKKTKYENVEQRSKS